MLTGSIQHSLICRMITIIATVTDSYKSSRLLRSLSANASSKDNYEVLLVGDPKVIGDMLVGFGTTINFSPDPHGDIFWPIDDNAIVLGSYWDKYLLYWSQKMEETSVLIPSTGGDKYPIWKKIQDTLPEKRYYVWQVNCV